MGERAATIVGHGRRPGRMLFLRAMYSHEQGCLAVRVYRRTALIAGNVRAITFPSLPAVLPAGRGADGAVLWTWTHIRARTLWPPTQARAAQLKRAARPLLELQHHRLKNSHLPDTTYPWWCVRQNTPSSRVTSAARHNALQPLSEGGNRSTWVCHHSAWIMASTDPLASPKSIEVFSLKNKGF